MRHIIDSPLREKGNLGKLFLYRKLQNNNFICPYDTWDLSRSTTVVENVRKEWMDDTSSFENAFSFRNSQRTGNLNELRPVIKITRGEHIGWKLH